MKAKKSSQKKRIAKGKAAVISQENKEKNDMKESRYFQSVGRRKKAIARVRIYPEVVQKEARTVRKNEENILINGSDYKTYFPLNCYQEMINAPMRIFSGKDIALVSVRVKGGGMKGQAEAIRLGISRALVNWDESLRRSLRDAGFLTRDSRIVERKKAGLKKARRAPQWQKR